MSDESQFLDREVPRPLRESERRLVEVLLQTGMTSAFNDVILHTVKVQEMADGEMGSLYFVHPHKPPSVRKLGRCVSEVQFKDSDGIVVSASLNLDCDGDLYELDLWKTDFSSLIDRHFSSLFS